MQTCSRMQIYTSLREAHAFFAFLVEVINFPELHLTMRSHIQWLCPSLPINQTGFPHGQVAHYNDFRDFKSAEGIERRDNK